MYKRSLQGNSKWIIKTLQQCLCWTGLFFCGWDSRFRPLICSRVVEKIKSRQGTFMYWEIMSKKELFFCHVFHKHMTCRLWWNCALHLVVLMFKGYTSLSPDDGNDLNMLFFTDKFVAAIQKAENCNCQPDGRWTYARTPRWLIILGRQVFIHVLVFEKWAKH